MSTQPILTDPHCLALDGLRLSAETVEVRVHAVGRTAQWRDWLLEWRDGKNGD